MVPVSRSRLGQLRIGRVPKDPIAPQDDGGIFRGHPELAQQGFGGLVLLEIDQPMREAVASGELPQPPGVGREMRTHDPEPVAQLDQDRSTDEIGTKHDVAQVGVGGHQLTEALQWHVDHLARLGDHRGDEHRLASQEAQLPKEASGSVHADDSPSGPGPSTVAIRPLTMTMKSQVRSP